jgi:hypothetical protein
MSEVMLVYMYEKTARKSRYVQETEYKSGLVSLQITVTLSGLVLYIEIV